MKECKIIQDLLPNYIENLTNEETNAFIERHLKECSECRKMFENMQREIKLNGNMRDKREVKYIKKYSNKMKILKFILLIILIVFVIIIGRKAIILKTMQSSIEQYKNKTNFHTTTTTYNGKSITITDVYHKDGKYLGSVQIAEVNSKGNKGIISYFDGKTFNTYISNGDNKIAMKGKESGINSKDTVYNLLEFDGWVFLKNLFTSNITSVKCNDKDCYKIDGIISPDYLYDAISPNSTLCIYLEKETGLPVRIENGIAYTNENDKVSSITDYFYEFDKVTDKDLAEPDISEYKIQE